MQGAQILRNEAYIEVRCNDEGCSATQQMDFLRSHQTQSELGESDHQTDRSSNTRLAQAKILMPTYAATR